MALFQGLVWREIAQIGQRHAEGLEQQAAVGAVRTLDCKVVDDKAHVANSGVLGANRGYVLRDGKLGVGLACASPFPVYGAHFEGQVATGPTDW